MRDPELERIRQEKLRALQEAQGGPEQEDAEARLAEEVASLEAMVKPRLSRKALDRYSNLKVAHPELALKALLIVAQAIQSGQLGSEELSDEAFAELLRRMSLLERKDFKIIRK
ncbi:MAG: DNA-binding protein [Candidatus Woesearchaeota archaeon]